ncbi:zinc finger BED domain-containing protein RICESLEEPER 1-like isoform X2, partial [Aphis craccivora]
MGRTISNPVIRMYFVYDLSTNTSTCTILDCPHPLRSGRHAGNLENHIKAFHPNEYKELRKQKTGPLDKMISVTKTTLTNVKLNKNNIIDACVQLVTTNGRLFTLLNDTGFRMIMDPIMNSIGGGMYLVVKVLRTQSYAALYKKENMKLCILDIVTRWNSTYLMLLRLIELKPFCKDHQLINADLFLSTQDWDRIAAIYLDPRYMCLLNAASKKKAVSHLLKTWSLKESISLTAIAIENSNQELVDQVDQDDNSNSLETNVITDDFEVYLRTTSQAQLELFYFTRLAMQYHL